MIAEEAYKLAREALCKVYNLKEVFEELNAQEHEESQKEEESSQECFIESLTDLLAQTYSFEDITGDTKSDNAVNFLNLKKKHIIKKCIEELLTSSRDNGIKHSRF